MDTTTRNRLDARALAVDDKATAKGDLALQAEVAAARTYLYDPDADATAAAALITALEKQSKPATAKPPTVVQPTTTTPATPATQLAAAPASGVSGWWSGLTRQHQVIYGLGAAIAAAALVWSVAQKKKKPRKKKA